jgi:hypothetical protein
LVLAACGGEAAPAKAPAQGIPGSLHEPVTELEAQQHDFDVSVAQFDEQLARRRSEVGSLSKAKKEQGPADGNATVPPPATAAVPKSEEKAPKAPAEGEASGGGVGSSCDLLCRALSSMKRSADGICGLTSEQHERCVSARQRVAMSARQLSDMGCACSQ